VKRCAERTRVYMDAIDAEIFGVCKIGDH